MRRLPVIPVGAALIGLFAACGAHDSSAADEPPLVEIRGDDGEVLVSANEIKSYDWTTHAITLSPGGRERLQAKLPRSRIVSGVPFALFVGDRPVYRGKITTVASSFSFNDPVIVIDGDVLDDTLRRDELRIQLGYPTPECYDGNDPRADDQLRVALKAAGKLIVDPADHVAWIDRSLHEVQTIKPGMTRAELLQVFVEEGGLSTRQERRYAFRECPYIKVDVRFAPADEESGESPEDVIASVSRPFLEWSIAD